MPFHTLEFKFWSSKICLFFSEYYAFCVKTKKQLPNPIQEIFTAIFSSKSFSFCSME
jgi:hypothetical protein